MGWNDFLRDMKIADFSNMLWKWSCKGIKHTRTQRASLVWASKRWGSPAGGRQAWHPSYMCFWGNSEQDPFLGRNMARHLMSNSAVKRINWKMNVRSRECPQWIVLSWCDQRFSHTLESTGLYFSPSLQRDKFCWSRGYTGLIPGTVNMFYTHRGKAAPILVEISDYQLWHYLTVVLIGKYSLSIHGAKRTARHIPFVY